MAFRQSIDCDVEDLSLAENGVTLGDVRDVWKDTFVVA